NTSHTHDYTLSLHDALPILSVSAVGSLKEEHKPTDFVIPDQFFDRTRHRVDTFFGDGVVAHVSLADPTCGELNKAFAAACRKSRSEEHTSELQSRGHLVCRL